MSDYKSELVKIKERITEINEEFHILLTEKTDLMKKKKALEQQIKSAISNDNIDFENESFPWSLTVNKILQDVFKLDKFRALQLKTINTTLSKRDCILIKPTGGGKSLCYQLPAIISGLTIAISPLVSLMQDQLLISKKFGIPCVSLDSNCPVKLQNEVYKSMQSDPVDKMKYKLIFVTPEKIAKSKKLMKAIEKCYADNRIARIVIDEIHCCSQWGHDFRPDYKGLHIFKSIFPKIPILGLTATATDSIINDIMEILGLNVDCLVYRDVYNRPNLFYDVKFLSNDDKDSHEICKLIKNRYAGQSGIVYCFTQKDCETLANELVLNGINACFYHASTSYEYRSDVHNKWLNEDCNVIVATIAFGMGIDKPNVRFVIHMSMSKSLENYYQESGRAGRDGKRSDCILFWKLSEYFKLASNLFTEKVGIKNLQIINQYCLDESVCKRALFAPIFGEKHSEDDCKTLCSICTDIESQLLPVDITNVYKSALKIIDNVEKSKNPNITGNKLVGELANQMNLFSADLVDRFPGIDIKLFFDKALCNLIHKGYLKLNFHFGSFTNYTYVVSGNKILTREEKINIFIRTPINVLKRKPDNIEILKSGKIKKSSVKRGFNEEDQKIDCTKLLKM